MTYIIGENFPKMKAYLISDLFESSVESSRVVKPEKDYKNQLWYQKIAAQVLPSIPNSSPCPTPNILNSLPAISSQTILIRGFIKGSD